MNTLVRVLFGVFLSLNLALAAEAGGPAKQAPETVVSSFYSWYLGKLNEGIAPIANDRAGLRKYISHRRLTRLVHEYDKGSLDVDYFTKAQDIMDDWQGHVAVSDVVAKDRDASAMVTLGNVDKWKLKVSLINTWDGWRIDKVVDLNTH